MRVADNGVNGAPPPQPERPQQPLQSPLAKYGNTDTCRGVMRAYELYRYNLLKSRYSNNGK